LDLRKSNGTEILSYLVNFIYPSQSTIEASNLLLQKGANKIIIIMQEKSVSLKDMEKDDRITEDIFSNSCPTPTKQE
jgi:hypothetical protein